MNYKIFTSLLIVATFAIGLFIGMKLNKPKIISNEQDLRKHILVHQFHIEKLRDTLHMKDSEILFLSRKIERTDSLLNLRQAHEKVTITRYTGAPVIVLDSALLARYPDSAAVARRGDR